MTTERTPLLENGTAHREGGDVVVFPTVRQAAALLDNDQPITAKHVRDLAPDTARAASVSHLHAFLFAVLLHLDSPHNEGQSDVSQLSPALASTIHTLTAELWASYSQAIISEHGADTTSVNASIRELLWTPLIVRDDVDSKEFSTVAELLAASIRPSYLLEQALVVQGVVSAWRYGTRWPPLPSPRQSTATALIRRLAAQVTPRVAHAVDAIVYTTYLASLAHILMKGLAESFGIQDIWVIIYALHSTLPLPTRRWSFTLRIGYLFALWGYVTPPHGRPEPESISHAWLLASFSWNTLLLLAPITPGWVFLFPPHASLQPAVEFAALVKPVVITPLLYFLPILLFFVYLLSRVMDDPWTLQPNFLRALAPSPYSTREVLFCLFLISVLLLIFFGFASLIRVASHPPDSPSTHDSPPSTPLSLAATRLLLQNTLVYSDWHFPGPIGFIPFFVVTVPSFIMRKLQARGYISTPSTSGSPPANWQRRRPEWGRRAHPHVALDWIETVLWWTLVWPPSFVVAGVWGWGWRAPPRSNGIPGGASHQ